jgi:hypothetical protein
VAPAFFSSPAMVSVKASSPLMMMCGLLFIV